MAETVQCPSCGGPLPPDAPAGVCPKCLLAAGFPSGPVGPGDAATTPATPSVSGFVPPAPAELARHFPQLEILELLGRGGMGAVYKARQPNLNRVVALKILPAEAGQDRAFAERFVREAQALAKLNHPQIVTIYDFGQSGGLYYFLMEFVDGVNLRQAMRAGDMKPDQALAIVPQVCEALQYAHDEGVVHRDIKPENILLDKRGRVKIADFGLSKLLGAGGPEIALTGTHQVMGTIRYMAPEQMEGTHAVDHRADIYSLGVVFYELLTGEVPMGRFEPPSHKVQVDIRLDEVVLRSLAREPEKRYQHASHVKTDVDLIRQSSGIVAAQLASAVHPGIVPADAKPAVPPPRPWIVPILGVLNILAGLMLMVVLIALMIPEDPNDPFEIAWNKAATKLPFYDLLTKLDDILVPTQYLAALAQFVSGVGLLLWKPWARKVAMGVCIYSLFDLVINIPGIVLQGIAPGFIVLADPAYLATDGTSEAEATALCVFFMVVITAFILTYLTFFMGQLVILNRPRVQAAFAPAETPLAPARVNLAVAALRNSEPIRIVSQTLPQDVTDFVHSAALVLVVPPLVFMIPGFFAYLIAIAIGRTPLDAVPIGLFVGGAVTIGLFIILGVGSLQSATLDASGFTLHRFAGPSKFLAWSEVIRIRLMNRWDVVRQVWIWPGLPPRGSIIGGSTKNYYSLDTRDGCWYFCPGDVATFLAVVRRMEGVTRRSLLQTDSAAAARPAGVGSALFAIGVFTLAAPVLVAIWFWLGGISLSMLWNMSSGSGSVPRAVDLPTQPGQAIYLDRHKSVVRDVAASGDGRYLVSVGDDGQFINYDLMSGAMRMVGIYGDLADKTTLGLRSVAVPKVGQDAYVVGNPRSPAIYKVSLAGIGYQPIPFTTTATTNKIAYWGGGNKLACIVGDKDYVVLDLEGKQTASAKIYPGKMFGAVGAMAASSNGTYLAVTSSNMVPDEGGMKSTEPAQLSVFIVTGQEVFTWKFADYADFSYSQMAWIDDRSLLLATPSGMLHRWDLNPAGTEWQPAEPVRIGPGRYLAAALSADRKAIWLATDRQVAAIDFRTGQTVAWANVDAGKRLGEFFAEPIEAIVAIPNTNLVAAALWDGRVAIVQPFIEK